MSKADVVIAAKAPMAVDLEEGKTYWWCTCGRSKSQPMCDGTHTGTGFAPMEYKSTMTRKKRFCACKHTKTPPFCDGTHNDL
ncbi:MAG: CDGSH iron-sulfur domain-containing protein [Rhodospirillaceae bacterium]